jgi:hypothetical protein
LTGYRLLEDRYPRTRHRLGFKQLSARSEEVPENKADENYRPGNDHSLNTIEAHITAGLNARRRSLLLSTETEDSDIAALARTGERSHPVTG